MTLVSDVVRTQARIKSIYRSRGVLVRGIDAYSSRRREEWLAQRPSTTQWPCPDPALLLSRQLVHSVTQIPTDLAEDRLLPVLRDEDDVKPKLPTTMT